MRKLLLIIALISLSLLSQAQVDEAQKFISKITEMMQENEVFESTIEDVTYTLTTWAETKPNINNIKSEDLLEMQLINPMQAADLFDYKKKNGDILTPFELVYLQSFTKEDIQNLMLFFSFGKKPEKQKNMKRYLWGRHEILTQYNRTLEVKDGYQDGDYEGSPGKKYFRYKYKLGQELSLGITAESDPGEALFNGSNPEGFDYYSMHLFVKPGEILQTVALGDFQTTLGQGLICGQGIWGGKGTQATQIRNARQGFRPYSSATEYGFMRGAAIQAGYKNITAGVFASYQDIDATVDTLKKPFITSLSATGLHRTEGEIAKKKTVNEFVTGGFIGGRFGSLKANINGIFTQYEHDVKRNSALYDLYDPDGNNFANFSTDFMYQLKKFSFFGEVAYSSEKSLAQLYGATFYPTESAGLALLYRNYDKEYVALYGYGFGESSGVQNEEGFYFGLEWLPFKYTTVNIYADVFSFPWLRYGEKAPTDGSEYLINIDYSPKRTIDFQTRFKYEKKSTTVSNDQFADLTYGELYKWHFQTTMDYTPEWTGQVRLAYSHFDQDSMQYNGWLIYYEHFYQPQNSKLKASFRINLFDVEDYLARIYTYERDVLYSFSVPSFQDTGIRYYLNLKWDVLENLSLYARIDRTEFLHKDEISSGNELIEESHRTSLHFKVRWKF